MYDLRIDPNCVDRAIAVEKSFDPCRWYPYRSLIFSEPFVDDFRDSSVFADKDEDRRARVLAVFLCEFFLPVSAESGNRVMAPFNDRFRLGAASRCAALSGCKLVHDPAPNIEIAGYLRASGVAHGQLGN